MYIHIQRIYQEDCTLGVLECDGLRLFTLELPWKDNKQDISCIKEGVYSGFVRHSNKNGTVIELNDVQGRSHVQIHSGNFTTQILGCVLVGDSIADINGDGVPDVTNSRKSLAKLLSKVKDFKEFNVIITG